MGSFTELQSTFLSLVREELQDAQYCSARGHRGTPETVRGESSFEEKLNKAVYDIQRAGEMAQRLE